MESANLHYKHQQQLVDQSSSPFATPFYEAEAAHAAWTPNSILNTGDFNPNINVTNTMTQDMGFGSFTGLSAHDQLQLTRIKDELSSSSSSSDHHSNYSKITNMLNNSSSSSIEDSHLSNTSSNSYIKNEQRNLLRNFSSGCQINGYQLPATGGLGGFYSNPQQKYCPTTALSDTNTVARGTFSQIFPTINISDLNQTASSNSSALSSSSLDMNLEALDLFNSSRFCTGLSQSSHDHLGLFKSCSLPSYNLDNMQLQLSPRPSNCPNNVSPFNNGVQEVKRSSSSLETKSPQAAPKKSRLDSRSTCPPFKVRKEKLGDRIAALQQLVAPFGKTDTASVLMEAIGYIKFLQNQVETLSVPYMKSSRNRTRKIQGGLGENAEEDGTRDLRTRGLCLVPLSCLSYMTDCGGAGVWPPPPPHYGGGS